MDNYTHSSVFIGLGSNLGNKKANINDAIASIAGLDSTDVTKTSSFYKTSPVGSVDQDWFINSVIKVKTRIAADALMSALLSIEEKLGRVRTEKWGARTIDIDMLFYNDEIINSERLTVPHEHLSERKFVLEPLSEIAGDFLHPVLNKTISQLLGELKTDEEVEKII